MKKFTVLVSIILCITIGGVYATWTYQTGATQTSHQHFNVYMGAVENSEAKGVLLTVTNALNIRLNDANNDYFAEADVTGYLEFVFKPGQNANDSVRQQGVDLKFTLEQTTPAMQYEGADVFVINNSVSPESAYSLGKGVLITDGNVATISAHNTDLSGYIGCFYYCMEANIFNNANYSMITTNIELSTYEDYLAMQHVLSTTGAEIGLTISEVPAATP